jgi:two-component system, NarL family, nitrate/nitrite response regulator NarL
MAGPRGTQREASAAPSGRAGSLSARHTYGELARVAVVSDQRLVRDAIKGALLNRGFSATSYGAPSGSNELWELSRQLERFGAAAGLVVCDLGDPRQLRGAAALIAGVRIRWLVLTGVLSGPTWGAMFAAGAVGVIPMSTGLDQLAQAVKAVVAGDPVMRPSTRARVLRQWRTEGAELEILADRMSTLTPRELQILERLSDGEPVKAIALEAGVSEGTVRSQVKSILRKLAVTSQLGAVAVHRRLREG